MENIICINGVSKSFGSEKAVDNLSFSIARGEIVGLLGPNGAGKTTTIRLLNGVIAADKGEIKVLGKDPLQEGGEVRRRSGVLTESAGLYEDLTAVENLLFFAKLYGVKGAFRRAEHMLRDFGLEKDKNRKVGTFSTGMKKRLGIAKALLSDPELLFLDEPTTGLDPEGARDLLQRIVDLNRQGVTILLSTHLLKQVQDLCHRFIFLDCGRLLEMGTLAGLEEKYPGDVSLKVETTLNVAGARFEGYPVEARFPGFVVFRVPDKSQVPSLLRAVLSEAPVFSAEIIGRDLETLYFKVRGRVS